MTMQTTNLQAILANPELAGNISLTVKGDDLIRALKEAAREIAEVKEPEEEKYLTPEQAAKMLQVSKVTLWNWKRAGILTGFKIGRQVRYRLSELKAIAENRKK